MEFIKGMDISMVKELEVSGASYYINGKQEDLFRILKECGTTMVRLRIWSDPFDEMGNSYGGGGNDLQTTIEIAGRTVENGLTGLFDGWEETMVWKFMSISRRPWAISG